MSFLTANPATVPMYLDFQVESKGVWKALADGNYREAFQRFIDGVSGAGAFERSPPELQKRMLQNAMTLYELTSGERDPFSREDAMAINAPTLLVSGEKTAPFLQEIIKRLAICLPKKECVVINKASHPMHSQNPLDYNKAVLGFLDSQKK